MEILHRIYRCDYRNNCDQSEWSKEFCSKSSGDGLAFLAMISWGFYSALIRKIGELEYPTIAVTRRIYFYGILRQNGLAQLRRVFIFMCPLL